MLCLYYSINRWVREPFAIPSHDAWRTLNDHLIVIFKSVQSVPKKVRKKRTPKSSNLPWQLRWRFLWHRVNDFNQSCLQDDFREAFDSHLALYCTFCGWFTIFWVFTIFIKPIWFNLFWVVTYLVGFYLSLLRYYLVSYFAPGLAAWILLAKN